MPPAPDAADDSAGRLGTLALIRIAGAARPVDRGEVAADLSMFADAQMPASRWREAVEAEISALAAAGSITPAPGGFTATPAGRAAAARFMGLAPNAALSWEKACSLWLVAKALGLRRMPAKRLAALATLAGLRAAVLVHSYGLQVKGAATPARLRQALAAAALKKAFGGEAAQAVAGKAGLPARASRLLAAQLLDKPRDPGTDRRLVSTLAIQACSARGADIAALRTAVLRRAFVVTEQSLPQRPERAPDTPAVVPTGPAADQIAEAVQGTQTVARDAGRQPPPPANGALTSRRLNLEDVAREVRRLATSLRDQGRPPSDSEPAAAPAALLTAPRVIDVPLDLPDFASEVRRCAAGEAQGWSGDRKAYISRVWRSLREKRPDWGLSEAEFKALLAEAHRSGQLALANADLKDEENIKDVQDSAVIYRNAVFHFIRVDA
jgi:hypothetical protein